ncbi:MAG: hypothetical protein ABIO55_03240, partial [Ginsengibacter sp.]
LFTWLSTGKNPIPNVPAVPVLIKFLLVVCIAIVYKIYTSHKCKELNYSFLAASKIDDVLKIE